MSRIARIFILLLLATACTPRAGLDVIPDPGVGKVFTIRVGSTRGLDPDSKEERYSERTDLSYLSYDISVPPNRKPGQVKFAGRRAPDPLTQFVAVGKQKFATAADFRADLAAAYRAEPKARNGVVVFVHGYNNTLGDAVFRITQLTNDLGIDEIPISYTWPSLANPLAYAHDRDSALFGRDGLEKFLLEISRSGTRSITIVGHSMGSLVVMETLRQLAIRNDKEVFPKLSGVILMSPDLDVDVFRSQAKRIGNLPQPFIIFTSRRDKALRLSARLSGETARLGNIPNIRPVADLNVTVIDVSNFKDGGLDHFTVGKSPAVLKILGQLGSVQDALRGDASGRAGLFPGTVLTVQNATSIILSPVSALSRN